MTLPPQSPALLQRLAAVLPKGHKFGVHHVSTPPTKCDALCSPPPDARPDKTYCESHFLLLSIDTRPKTSSDDASPAPVPVLAVEVFIFTTAFSSIFFVSKADSTGFLERLNLPKGTPSPIRQVCSAFIAHLVEHRARPGLQSVVTLFARAQPQYLFVGSVDNHTKHVLDDRGLVRWWCKVLNPLVEQPPPPSAQSRAWGAAKAYLVVPGLDTYETKAFIPKTPLGMTNWVVGQPMERISHYTREYDWVPARCLIPRYPDDPKSRFRDDLDEEAAKSKVLLTTGSWKSVTTVEQFWELMAYRQECSSGRLTGFIWLVFDPEDTSRRPTTPEQQRPATPPESQASMADAMMSDAPATPPRQTGQTRTPLTTPRKIMPATTVGPGRTASDLRRKKTPKKRKLTGKIRSRQPHIKTRLRNYLEDRPQATAYYYWPPEGRGQKLVSETDYKRAVELLLHLNFAGLDRAVGSTRRWLAEVGAGTAWGVEIEGLRDVPTARAGEATAPVVNVLTSMVKRKRTESNVHVGTATIVNAAMDEKNGTNAAPKTETSSNGTSQVNVLGGGLVRKKPKS